MLFRFVLGRCKELPYHTVRNISATARFFNLNEFFDDPKTWGQTAVSAGRPWRKEELRLKSNIDLHKLWYILLKERNMLMTMEEEHNRRLERMPNAERFEKVEESMENLLMVVEERNRAEAELEHGEWIGPVVVDCVDALGRATAKLTSEHEDPQVADKRSQADEQMWSDTTVNLLRRERELKIQKARDKARKILFETRIQRLKQLNYLDESSLDKIQS